MHTTIRTAGQWAVGLILFMVAAIMPPANAASEVDDHFVKKSTQKTWKLNITGKYGTDPKLTKTSDGIMLSPLTPASAPYLGYLRPVDIKEGVTYALSFEARATGGSYVVRIPEWDRKMNYAIHFASKALPASTEFKVHEFQFTGKPLVNIGRTGPQAKNREYGAYLGMLIGVVEGTFELKWLKLSELPSP